MKKGYKQTEIGFIPEDWKIDRIRNLAVITTGSRNTQDRIDTGQYPFFVRSQKVERINTYSFDGEAVLTAGDGVGTGKVFHYIKGKFDFHQRVYKISDFNENIDGFFFFLYFSNAFLKRIMSMTAKSSVDSVRMEMIANMLIPLPPKDEQIAIAKAVFDVTTFIESLNELIEKKKNIKQGAMQELLTGKKRLPGFTDELVIERLDELAFINMGQSPDSHYYNEKGLGLPLIQGNADIEARRSVQRIWTTQITKTCDEGDLILTVRAPVGSVGIATKRSCIGRGVCALKPNGTDRLYLYQLLIFSENGWKKLEQGSTFTSANSSQIGGFELSITKSRSEQTTIAQFLTDMDSEVNALERKRDKYKLLKVGLMQQLLTGRIRLKCKN